MCDAESSESQLRSLLPKQMGNPRYGIARSETEISRDWRLVDHLAQGFPIQMITWVWGLFEVVQTQSAWVFRMFYNRRRNIHSPQYTKDRAALERASLSVNKVVMRVFLDIRSIIHIDYIQEQRTINSDYNANLLVQFKDDLKGKQQYLARNAKVFTCVTI